MEADNDLCLEKVAVLKVHLCRDSTTDTQKAEKFFGIFCIG